ncbi:MAG: proline--tRNA ligase [Deltaproteobacteria bacterium]|nr:proline--tRNA ligase [Deltaproteobacteria bacterium]
MKRSQLLVPTLKEAPAEAQVVSHILLLRAGMIRKVAAGIYNFLPLGWRAVRKVEQIIREEMNRAGAQEVHMPVVCPAELWQESGRWTKYGPELLRLKDRKDTDFCLGPTHEEVVVAMVRADVRSYRELPLNLYQIQTKFRDEIRPRFGLMRGREFIMKDAYSFDVDQAAAMVAYQKMFDAYGAIFRRCGLEFRAVEADTGNIGGSSSHEFQVLAESGEDLIFACDACTYAANAEKAAVGKRGETTESQSFGDQRRKEKEVVATPGKGKVEEVAAFMGASAREFVKTLIVRVDEFRERSAGKPVAGPRERNGEPDGTEGATHTMLAALCVRGDHEANPVKLKLLLGAGTVELASDEEVTRATHAAVGFAGPVGLDLPVYVDHDAAALETFISGANQTDAHVKNCVWGRDAKPTQVADLRVAAVGDPCPRCADGHLKTHRGIEVGHVFYLGDKYSRAMNAVYQDAGGNDAPFVMGCYGIGVTRTMASAIEQSHDKDGIVWPMSIAPFHVAILPLLSPTGDGAKTAAIADEMERALEARGVEVLVDDRDERPGVKFKDADLIGLPLRVSIGKKTLETGKVEVKWRSQKEAVLMAPEEAVAWIAAEVAKAVEI